MVEWIQWIFLVEAMAENAQNQLQTLNHQQLSIHSWSPESSQWAQIHFLWWQWERLSLRNGKWFGSVTYLIAVRISPEGGISVFTPQSKLRCFYLLIPTEHWGWARHPCVDGHLRPWSEVFPLRVMLIMNLLKSGIRQMLCLHCRICLGS